MQKQFLSKSKIPVSWKNKSLIVEWNDEETSFINHSFTDWDISSRSIDILKKTQRNWEINYDGTRHCRSDTFNLNTKEITKFIIGKDHRCSLLKIKPGNCIPWHYDTHRSYMYFNNVKENDIQRSIVMMNNWKVGQVLQFRKEIISHWQIGDMFTWKNNVWHGAANFGNKDLIIMMIDYQPLDNQ